MAQTDTGLGWSAKSEWLVQNANVPIASISIFGGPSYPGQPIPKNITAPAEIISGGLKMLDHDASVPSDPDTYTLYCAAEGNYDVLAFSIADPQNVRYGFITKTQNARVNVLELNNNSGRYSINPFTLSYAYQGFYISTISTTFRNPTFYLPIFASLDDAINNVIVQTANITKTTAGYSVACVAKWKTPTGARFESPMLISTDSNFVDMQTDITGISLAKLNIFYQGRKFYMAFYDRPYDGSLETNFPVIDEVREDAPAYTLDELFKYIAREINANILVTYAPDPYTEGTEESSEGGGDGEEDEEENVNFTDPPSTAITASGFLTIFCPSLGQLQNLAGFMWTSFDLDNWRRLFANPMDAILGLHIIPVPPYVSGTKTVKVAGISTEIMMDYTTIRYIRRSMGTCEIPKKWGAYLDYNPYTKVSIFLPYIGFRDLDTDDIMGRTIGLQYIVDVLSGACVAELKCGDTILYSWEGNCANQVPITGGSWDGLISSALGIAGAIATTALTHGASAPMIAGTIASVGANSMNLKPSVTRSGSISGSGGFIAAQRPYIIRTIPNLVIPTDQNKFIGYPSFVTTSLGNLMGYNEIASIHLEGIPATGNELSEIETLLKGGVIF